MNLNQAHLSVEYQGKKDELYNVLINLTGSMEANGSENFEVSDKEMVTFFYEGTPIETTYFKITGQPGTCEASEDSFLGERKYDCFHIDEIEEISKDKAERLAGLS